MKLLDELLQEYGADTLKSFTVIPDFGGYFCGIKGVTEYSPQKITLTLNKHCVKIFGENLSIGKYFQQDLLILGNISGVQVE